jgi:hypothetical protein
MKHPLNGAAIAAVIAIAAPAWAQAPGTLVNPPAPAAAARSTAPASPAKRPVSKGLGASRDRIADRLNRAELTTLARGTSVAPMVPVAGYPPPYPAPWWGYRPLWRYPPPYPAPWWGYPWRYPRLY